MPRDTQYGPSQPIRFTREQMARIEKYKAKMQAKNPGMVVGFSGAVRALVEKGLAAENGR